MPAGDAAMARSRPAGAFGEWLAGMLHRRNMRQVDLATAMGINQSHVSKWVRGSRIPSPPYCEAIAKALGVPPYEVLARASRVPEQYRIPTSDPTRDRAHALVDALDPETLAPVVAILERLHSLGGRSS